MKNIYGKTKISKDIKKTLSEFIDKNIIPIKAFLAETNDRRILCINSKWGSGKTTSLLIAINETKKDDFYIYESAFKYHGNIREFINDLLNSLERDMSKIGLHTNPIVDSLMHNLDSSIQKTLANLLKNHEKRNIPSSELILELNHEYEKSKNTKHIRIIIDDIDRLQGDDIVEILSVLSILRNLSFVKIIIPADLDVVNKALDKYGVIDAQRFVEKYLPSKMSLALYSGYDMAEKIILDKIFYAQDSWDDSSDGAYPALAAIFIGMLAEKLKTETKDYNKVRYRWLADPNPFRDGTRELPENMNETVSQLLQETPALIRKQPNFLEKKYNWNKKYNNITKFQNIIYAITKDFTGTPKPIAKLFSDEEYLDVIDSWIFNYMEKRWDIFGFTIRDALDILESTDYKNLPKNTAEQFAYIFNQLFEKEQLEPVKQKPNQPPIPPQPMI